MNLECPAFVSGILKLPGYHGREILAQMYIPRYLDRVNIYSSIYAELSTEILHLQPLSYLGRLRHHHS